MRQRFRGCVHRFCSPVRQTAMMKLIAYFIEQTERAVSREVRVEDIKALPVMRRLRRMVENSLASQYHAWL